MLCPTSTTWRNGWTNPNPVPVALVGECSIQLWNVARQRWESSSSLGERRNHEIPSPVHFHTARVSAALKITR